MSLITRLMGRAPESDRPEAGRAAEPTATGSLPKETSEGVAALSYGAPLVELAYGDASAEQRSAQQRLVELIDSGSLSIASLPWDADRQTTTLAIAAATAEPANFNALAQRVSTPETWVKLAISGTTAKLRQLAASRVVAEDALRAVIKHAKERDKNVYRIVKTKLDELHAAARQLEQAQAHMLSLAETIERQSFKPFDGAYIAAIDHLEREWRSLTIDVPDEVRAKAEAGIDRARNIIAEHIRAEGMRAAHEAAVANAGPLRESAIDELKKILVLLYAATSFGAEEAAQIAARVIKLNERWSDTLGYKPAGAEETQTFQALRDAVETVSRVAVKAGLLSQLLETFRATPSQDVAGNIKTWLAPRSLLGDAAPAIVEDADAALRAWKDEQRAQRAAAEDAERQLHSLIRKAQHALAGGRSRQAFGMRRTIASKLERLPNPPKAMLERLQQLDAKLAEIQDWRSFAVTPKRSELIAEMQALVGSERDPVELAEEIKRLQEEWKSLAKGADDSEADWHAFHAAAQAAYAPCKAHFEAQAQERQRNLDRRKALLAKLEAYERSTDWERVDWKNVANALRAAKQEWRTAGPTDRAATKPIEKRFDELLASLQRRLEEEYATNLERKRLLVNQAQRAAANEDLTAAANEVKRLQSAWRAVGLTPHSEGQALWEAFREHCDAVFEKRRSLHNERMAELDQNAEAAVALCVEAETLAHREGSELLAGAGRIRELREAFERIGELPRERAHEIKGRFRRAVEEFDHAVRRERRMQVESTWETFFEFGNQIRLLELEPTPELETSIRQRIESVEHWPKGGRQAIEQKLSKTPEQNLASNADKLRVLVIRAEIATGAATPDSDQSQRRAIQLQALVKGIGRGTSNVQEQMEALAFEWVAAAPVASEIYDELFARFKRCWTLARK